MIKLIKQNQNFRKLAVYITLAGIPQSIFAIFMMWVVHATYQNPMYTGIAAALLMVPFIFSFIAGPLVDRWNKATVMRLSMLAEFAAVGALIFSYFINYPGVWLFFVVILVFRMAQTFASPALNALIPKMIEGNDLTAANSAFNIVGLISGVPFLVVMFLVMGQEGGFGIIYIIVAITLLFAAFSTFLLPNDKDKQKDKYALKSYFKELGAGFAFAKRTVLFPLMIATFSMSFVDDAAYANFPAFAGLHMGDASGYVLLSALALLGSLIGSIVVAIFHNKLSLVKIIVGGLIVTGLVRIAFVQLIQINIVAGVLVYVIYMGMATVFAIFFHVITQTVPPNNLVGRISTNVTSLSALMAALGALLGGFLGHIINDINIIFLLQGAIYVLIALCLLLSKKVRKLPKMSELKPRE